MTRYRTNFLFSLAVFLGSGSACSVVVDSERVQCRTNSDCAAYGADYAKYVCTESVCQPDPTWACLAEPPSTELPSSTVHLSLTLVDLLSQRPLPGVLLTLCGKLDAECVQPLAQYKSNQAGQLDVELPFNFDGYFETQGDGLYPTLFFPPRANRQRAPSTLAIVADSFFGVMFSGVIGGVSPDRTVIMTTAMDCRGRPAAGVLLSSSQVDERTVSYVLEGGLPSRTATMTDQSGVGGFVNIKPGSAVITSTIAADNKVAGTVGVQARPGHLTMVLVMPTGG